jgi:subfamily B ATP-binding cassette protein MsbA
MVKMEKHNIRYLVKRIAKAYLKPYFGRIGFALFWMVVASAMTGLFAWIIGPVMDHVMVPGNGNYILPICILLFVSMVIRGGATYLHTVQMAKVSHSVVADIQSGLFTHMLCLDVRFFQDNMSGSLVARVISDVQVMRSALSDSMTGIGKNFVTLVILVGIMFYRDWVLALTAFTIFPLIAIYVMRLGKKLRSISNRTQNAVSNMTAGLSQTFQSVWQVRAFGREDFETKRTNNILHQVRDLNIKTTKTSNLSTPINDILVGVILFAVIFYGGLQVAQGNATAGDIMSFITA